MLSIKIVLPVTHRVTLRKGLFKIQSKPFQKQQSHSQKIFIRINFAFTQFDKILIIR